MAKKSIELTNEYLTKANASGDDTNLAENGSNPYYLYSIGDGFRLALWLRQHFLRYTNMPVEGEEYAASRENDNNILVTDPYYAGSFKNYLNDDISRITATGDFKTQVKPWEHMPKAIIIPLLAGFHWGIIKIDIDYGNKEVSILFDDPYGEIGLIHSFKNTFVPIIVGNIEYLIRQETRDDTFVLTEDKIKCGTKIIDQQGRYINSWDCGAIAFSNVEDYVESIRGESEVQYTIPACNETVHKSQIASARAKHINRYKEVAGISVASAEERLREAEKLLEGANQERKIGLKKLSGNYDYSKLSDAEISMLFTVLENKRLFEGENITESYTESELGYAYEFVLGYSHNYRNKGQDSVGYAVSARANTAPISIPEDEQALDKAISELEKKLFPELHSSNPLILPNPQKEKAKVLSNITEAYENGIRHYQEGNQVLAEQELVKALRPVLSKPSMKNIYVNTEEVKDKVLGAMYHLGLVYQASDQYFDHHSKAAAIFQYCASFAEEHEIALKLKENIVGDAEYFIKQAHLTEQEFLKSIGKGSSAENDSHITSQRQTTEYKQQLSEIRSKIKVKLEEVNSLTLERIDARTKAIEEIYGYSSSFFVSQEGEGSEDSTSASGLVQKLLADCHDQLGGVPAGCEYAVIGLGSLAGGRMTPWSDLEFAILVNEDKEEYKEYFRNLTKLLHIKIINLGETPLRSVGVEALNNFRTAKGEHEWFWDDLTTNGFSFDGPDWHACKLPLGRQGNYKAAGKVKNEHGIEETIIEEKPDYDLILTPKQMAAFQKEEQGWFKSDVYLVQGLRFVSLIDGSQALLDNYRQEVRAAEDPEIIRKRALEKLTKDLRDFSLKVGDEAEGKLIDVKKDIFRIGDRIIDDLANYYGIMAEAGQPQLTAWEMIDKMLKMDILSKEGAGHLKEALSIAAGLRLDTYSHNKGQKETVSTYHPAVEHLSEEQKHKLLHETFYIKDTSILHHFYYVILRLQGLAEGFAKRERHDEAELSLKSNNLFADHDYAKGMVHARFLEYTKALHHLEMAKNKQPENFIVLRNLSALYAKTQAIGKLLKLAEEMLGIVQNKPTDVNPLDIAAGLNNLGTVYLSKGDYESALRYFKQAQEIQVKAYEHVPNHPDIAVSYANLGIAYKDKGDYGTAVGHYKQALKIQLKAYGHNPNHPSIASSYNNLGSIYLDIGEYELALKFFKQALKVYLKVYEQNPNHPDIAMLYGNLGTTYNCKGEYEASIEHHKLALEIQFKAYASCPNHPDIAVSYNNLGNTFHSKGEYKPAIEYYEQALNIYIQVHALNLNHPSIAVSYNNLGNVFYSKGEHDSAIEHHKLALGIQTMVYGSNSNHPDIAKSHNNLGNVFYSKGEYELAIQCYTRALHMCIEVHKQNPNHLSVAYGYNNLGNVFYSKGEYELATEYRERALDIYLKAYEHNPNHPHIAMGYNNLGCAFLNRGKYELAIEYHELALETQFKAYGTHSNHPDIAKSYNNLGNVYSARREYEPAIKYFKQALDIRLKVYSSNPYHPEIATSYNNLGNVYSNMGYYEAAIKQHKQALEIYLIVHEQNSNHPDIAKSYNNLGVIYAAKGEYELAIKYFKQILDIRLKIYEQNLYHLDVAVSYNNLGNAYNDTSNYASAIEHHKKALEIYLKVHWQDLNHSDIIMSYNNLGVAFRNKGDYVPAIKHFEEALGRQFAVVEQSTSYLNIAKSYNNLALTYFIGGNFEQAQLQANKVFSICPMTEQDIINSARTIICASSIQLGNVAYLANDFFKARSCLANLHFMYQWIDFNSAEFVHLQISQANIAYEFSALSSMINCQLVLLKADPALLYGNHYHNLGRVYACKGEIKEAHKAFAQALRYPMAQITDSIYVGYAQFLILNASSLNITFQEISNFLYLAVNTHNVSICQYGKIEQGAVCSILQDLIKQKKATIQVNPKVLAHYLLITHPEYLLEGDSIDNLLENFCELCDNLQDEVSLKMLAYAYEVTGHHDLAEQYTIQATTFAKIDELITGRANLSGSEKEIEEIGKVADKLQEAGGRAVLEHRTGDAIRFYNKIFLIYSKILPGEVEHLKAAIDSLATVILLCGDLNQFANLKLQFRAELNVELIQVSGQSIDHLLAIDEQISIQQQFILAQQSIGAGDASAHNELTVRNPDEVGITGGNM